VARPVLQGWDDSQLFLRTQESSLLRNLRRIVLIQALIQKRLGI
jgi:hypothetical protein